MDSLLACPACTGALDALWRCCACGAQYACSDGIADLRLTSDARTDVVRAFYEQSPFPGYPPRDSLSALRARAERSHFVQALDAAIAGDATIVEAGCGTGQMSLYLARAERRIVALDLSRAALQLGAQAAQRFGINSVQFAETDLRRPGVQRGVFDVVISLGVLHHTPDPAAAFRQLVPLARPGGIIVLGLYNRYARLPLRLRRSVARLSGYRWIPFDPVLRERASEPARREAWLRDQYQHPEEHRHTLGEVQRWFVDNHVDYLRSYPSALLGDDERDAPLFSAAPDRWGLEQTLAQLGWMTRLGHEGGLFVTIGQTRRPA